MSYDNSYDRYRPPEQYEEDESVDEFMQNASWENEHSDHGDSRTRYSDTTRHSQAAVGMARLSLPLSSATGPEGMDYLPYDHISSTRVNYPIDYPDEPTRDMRQSLHFSRTLSQARPQPYHPVPRREKDSSSSEALPSSPAFQASQRQQNPEVLIPARSHVLPSKAQQKMPDLDTRPVVQGIRLVPVHALADHFGTIFPFAMFNAVQSACFESIYESDDNCVFSSPTGSGKTVLFEIAICRMLRGWQNGSFKVIYMAPTKSLCSERVRDWKAKFEPLDLRCEELTGDSDINSLHYVQKADIIVTTPEKWDSMTRKWKDHEKLVRLIKLFLIDEVHILNKDRGAILEVVVSRMKSIGAGVRFIALSATVPNSQDIATWLGRNSDTQTVPAIQKRFGEEFRPVELKRHVCGYQSNTNAFAFDSILTKKLSDVITKYSQKKPIMIFCFTRKSCSEAANFLTQWWLSSTPNNRFWSRPTRQISVESKELQETVVAGVAVHHAGLSQDDRNAVEKAYLAGDLSVICCTSTLAVGVNLPCHMVIIKSTVSYEAGAVKEYSDLEVMQMIGRAGRPQFDTSAMAVIMTRLQQVKHYEQLLSGQERLESCLHLNLIEHLNAEIGLGMIPDLYAAKTWLAGTFLRVRLEDNPTHYQIQGDTPGRDLGARMEQICCNAISRLEKLELIETHPTFKSTEYGEAMARYYMNISTMELILSLPRKPKISEILAIISQAHEFREIRFRGAEKSAYKDLNEMPDIRFPSKLDLSTAAQKVSLVIQATLGDIRHLTEKSDHRTQYNSDQFLIFQHVHRLIRCIVDCQNYGGDAIGIRNSLMLSRSLAARVWDDSPMVLRQIEQIGPVAIRRLVSAKITTMDEFANTDPGRLELLLNKAPPFGWNLRSRIQTFPKMRIGVRITGQHTIKPGEHVLVNLQVDFGFLNEKTPTTYRNKPIFVIVLVGTSDGQKITFFRTSAQKFERVKQINATAKLTSPTQLIECYVMCDDLAGTMQQATLKPDIPGSAFQSIKHLAVFKGKTSTIPGPVRMANSQDKTRLAQVSGDVDEWDDGGVNDDDLLGTEPMESEFWDVDEVSHPTLNKPNTGKAKKKASVADALPERLANGNFACYHACKDKTACRHPCCKEGVKKAKPRKTKETEPPPARRKNNAGTTSPKMTQSKLELPIRKKTAGEPVEHLDLSRSEDTQSAKASATATRLARLDQNTFKSSKISTLELTSPTPMPTSFTSFENPSRHVTELTKPSLIESMNTLDSIEEDISDEPLAADEEFLDRDDDFLDKDEDMLDAVFVGLEDSRSLQDSYKVGEMTSGPVSPVKAGHEVGYDSYSSEAGLLMTPYPTQYNSAWQGYSHVDDDNDDDGPGTHRSEKRKLEETAPSTYLLAKKCRAGDERGSYSDEVQAQGDRQVEESEEDKEKREVKALEAWVASEFGDMVVMIDG